MGVRAGCWLLALSGLLAACSSEEPPGALPPVGTAVNSPSANTEASATATPDEAKPATAPAASAIARFYLKEVNEAYASQQVAFLSQLTSEECNACRNIVSDINRLKESKRSVAGLRFRVGPTAAAPPDASGQVVVDVRYDSDGYREVDGAGAVFRDNAAREKQDLQLALVRSGDSWLVRGLRLV